MVLIWAEIVLLRDGYFTSSGIQQLATINKLEKHFYLSPWFSYQIPRKIPYQNIISVRGTLTIHAWKICFIEAQYFWRRFSNLKNFFLLLSCYEVGCDPNLTKLEFSLSKKALSQVWLTIEPRGSLEKINISYSVVISYWRGNVKIKISLFQKLVLSLNWLRDYASSEPTGMVAYFCHQLSDIYVDLSNLYVEMSVIYVDMSDHYVDLSEKYQHNE